MTGVYAGVPVERTASTDPLGSCRRGGTGGWVRGSAPALAAGLALALLAGATSAADPPVTLPAALVRAYAANPSLNSARATQRASEENVAIARAGYRPTLSAQVGGVASSAERESFRRGTVGLAIDQSLFDFGRTRSAVDAATAQALAGRGNLDNTEQNLILQASTAYLDVRRDRAILDARERNLSFLERQLRQSRDLFSAGEATRTDVAQAEAGLAGAEAAISAAGAALVASESSYRRTIGEAPGVLAPFELDAGRLPSTLESARERAVAEHPAIRAARVLASAAQATLAGARAAHRPTLGLVGSVQDAADDIATTSPLHQDGTTASLTLELNVPIYQGGQLSARRRQAREQLAASELDLESAREQVLAGVDTAWAQRESAREARTASVAQLAAARRALEGVLNQRDEGLATTLDVLTTQQSVLNARVAIAQATHDAAVAGFTLLGAVGALNARALGLPLERHAVCECLDAFVEPNRHTVPSRR